MASVTLHRLNIDAPRGRYVLDSSTGSWDFRAAVSIQAAVVDCVGVGDIVQTRDPQDRELFAAAYADNGTLVVRLGGLVCAAPPDMWGNGRPYQTTRNVSLWTETPHFTLVRDGTPLFETQYVARPDDGVPGAMARDILFHIARTTETPSRAARFVYHWTANAAGRDTTTQAFVDEAAAYGRNAGL